MTKYVNNGHGQRLRETTVNRWAAAARKLEKTPVRKDPRRPKQNSRKRRRDAWNKWHNVTKVNGVKIFSSERTVNGHILYDEVHVGNVDDVCGCL